MSKSLKGKVYYVQTGVLREIENQLSRHIDVLFGYGQYCLGGCEICLIPLILRSEICIKVEMRVDHQVLFRVLQCIKRNYNIDQVRIIF